MLQTIGVPVKLLRYAHDHKMNKAVGLYLVLKCMCDGHIHLKSETIREVMVLSTIADRRSFKKHFSLLVKHNWVGFDEKTETCYVRSFKSLRKRFGMMNSMAVEFHLQKDAANATEFVQASLMGYELVKMERARKAVVIKRAGRSALKKESALQELAACKLISSHIGLSLSRLGKIWDVSQSQADRIKSKLIELGYISVKARYDTVITSDSPDMSLCKYLPQNRRYSMKKKVQKGNVVYVILARTYDEMTSLMRFSRQKRIVRNLRDERMRTK